MKRKKFIAIVVAGLFFVINTNLNVLAMDSFDMINNFNMDMIIDQSLHAMDSMSFITDLAENNNALNHTLDEVMLFPDILDIINLNSESVPENKIEDLSQDIIAIDGGMWMPEFNDFFNQPTAEIPVDIEMVGLDSSMQTVPVFQNISQDTIENLPDSSGMDNNHSFDLHFSENDKFFEDNGNIDNTLSYADEEGVRGNIDFAESSNTVELNWDTMQSPSAVLDAVQPEINTDMMEAVGGEMETVPEHVTENFLTENQQEFSHPL